VAQDNDSLCACADAADGYADQEQYRICSKGRQRQDGCGYCCAERAFNGDYDGLSGDAAADDATADDATTTDERNADAGRANDAAELVDMSDASTGAYAAKRQVPHLWNEFNTTQITPREKAGPPRMTDEYRTKNIEFRNSLFVIQYSIFV